MDLLEQLKRDEGLRLFPYTDTVGKMTIGVGHNLSDNGISYDQAISILQDDIKTAQDALRTKLPLYSTLDPVRQAALENMVFNLGIARFLGFQKAIARMQEGNWDGAASEILDSQWAGQVGKGYDAAGRPTGRASRLAEQLRTGEWV